ncbi:MAG: type II toxin-antitoxin system Phd/YefM family antitoxin [Phycisphaerales bacterium]|nr:type II toxin-antitoxin system Phd/YefM family antitoxin [Phycisphaerales bacterium]
MRMNISIAHFRNNMADPINRAVYAGERVILTRDGKPAVALVGLDDLRALEELENQADLKAARKARKEKGGVSLERIQARLASR